MIEFQHVSVAVSTWQEVGGPTSRTLLAGVHVDLPEQRVAVIGANGSGKSTLLRLINGLVRPTTGRVLVDGMDVSRRTSEVRQRVGFVFADPLSQLVMPTPLEDVELGLHRRIRDRRRRREHAEQVLARHGLGAIASSSIYDLSGGERQLVALAGVLAVHPQVLVADEPTTLLDLRNQRRLQQILLDLPQQLVVATHDLEFAAMLDRGLVVDDGQIVFDGAAREAVHRYREMCA